MNTARELECHDARTLRLVRKATARMTDIFELAIRQARAEGSIPAEGDPRACAAFYPASVSGVRSLLQVRVARELVGAAAQRAPDVLRLNPQRST